MNRDRNNENTEQSEPGQNLGVEPVDEEERGEIGISERANRSRPEDILPDDTPDLVERMEAMVRSGIIDADAFAGEPVHDDEPDTYGSTGEDDTTADAD